VERFGRRLLAAIEDRSAGAFVADTAPIIYRVTRGPDKQFVAACDPLFDAVEDDELGCIVSAASLAELLIEPFRAGPAAVSAIDAFLRQRAIGIAEVDEVVARTAAELLASRRLNRLSSAVVGATALCYSIPVVTGDRVLARGLGGAALLVADYR
jgi:hypothetical protein